jgi:hypothetical protein
MTDSRPWLQGDEALAVPGCGTVGGGGLVFKCLDGGTDHWTGAQTVVGRADLPLRAVLLAGAGPVPPPRPMQNTSSYGRPVPAFVLFTHHRTPYDICKTPPSGAAPSCQSRAPRAEAVPAAAQDSGCRAFFELPLCGSAPVGGLPAPRLAVAVSLGDPAAALRPEEMDGLRQLQRLEAAVDPATRCGKALSRDARFQAPRRLCSGL